MCVLLETSPLVSLAANADTFAALPRSAACGREGTVAFREKLRKSFKKESAKVRAPESVTFQAVRVAEYAEGVLCRAVRLSGFFL